MTKEEKKKYYAEAKKNAKSAQWVQETTAKFDKYFYYAIKTKNQNISSGMDTPQCTLSSQCKDGSG